MTVSVYHMAYILNAEPHYAVDVLNLSPMCWPNSLVSYALLSIIFFFFQAPSYVVSFLTTLFKVLRKWI